MGPGGIRPPTSSQAGGPGCSQWTLIYEPCGDTPVGNEAKRSKAWRGRVLYMQESTLKRSGTSIARDATCVAGGLAQRAPDAQRSSTVSSISALIAHFAAGITCSWAVGSVTPTRSRRGVRRRKFPCRPRFCAKVEQKWSKSGASRKPLLWKWPIKKKHVYIKVAPQSNRLAAHPLAGQAAAARAGLAFARARTE